jgi:hypothetical protein
MLMLVPAGVIGEDPGGDAGEDRASRIFVEPGLEYVAIAPTYLARYLGPLIEWKMDRGVPAQIFNIEQVLGTSAGRDNAERLHNFLQNLYFNETDGSPQWLLLAGDAELIPVRYLWADRDHSGDTQRARNLYIGDTYYSGLESEWDTDGDDVFGEPGEEDLTPELYVGRIAAVLPEEIQAAVAKTLSYELYPPAGDWFENAFLAGALMDEPNLLDDPYTLPGQGGYSDEGFDPYTDNAYEVTQKVRAVLGDDYDFIELADYPYFEGCHYTAINDTLHLLSSRTAWRRGNAFAFWASHGYEAFGGLAEYHGTGLSGMFESAGPFITTDETSTPVTGGMLPLVYISSCYAGQFDKADSTNFESMLTIPEGGAIGLIAGDGDTFRLENISYRSFGNWWLSERFWQLVVDEGVVRPGEALYRLKQEYHEYYLTEGPPIEDKINHDYFYANLYSYNLQGDPEVPVWVGSPGRISLELMGGAVIDSPIMALRITDSETGEPLEGARVFARGAGIGSALEAITGPDGMATIDGGPTELGGELRFAATATNWVPARMQVNVTEGWRDLTIPDELVSGPTTAEFLSQILEWNVTVTNAGDFSATSVTVRFESGDDNAPDEEGVNGRYETRVVDLAPGTSQVLAFHHRYTSPGQYSIVVEVDPDDAIDEDNEINNLVLRSLLLRPLPTLPESVGPIVVQAGEVHDWPVDLDFYVELPNGFPRQVDFQLGHVTDGVGAWIDDGNNLFLLAGESARGTATVTVMMLTEGEMADEMTVLLEVVQENRPPAIVPIADQEVEAGDELVLSVNASDPDGDEITLATSLPGATWDGGTLRWTPATDEGGTLFPTVTASDPDGATAQVRFKVTVIGVNSLPRIQGFDDELKVEGDERVHILVTALDPDDDPLTYHLASPDEGFSIERATGLVTFDPEGLASGRYSTIVVVSDGKGSDQRTLEVEVEATSSVPTFVLLVAGLLLLAAIGSMYMFRD